MDLKQKFKIFTYESWSKVCIKLYTKMKTQHFYLNLYKNRKFNAYEKFVWKRNDYGKLARNVGIKENQLEMLELWKISSKRMN